MSPPPTAQTRRTPDGHQFREPADMHPLDAKALSNYLTPLGLIVDPNVESPTVRDRLGQP